MIFTTPSRALVGRMACLARGANLLQCGLCLVLVFALGSVIQGLRVGVIGFCEILKIGLLPTRRIVFFKQRTELYEFLGQLLYLAPIG